MLAGRLIWSMELAVPTLDEDVLVTNFGDGGTLLKLQTIEASLSYDLPLLGCRWCHCAKCEVM
jgi:hypothetical protein